MGKEKEENVVLELKSELEKTVGEFKVLLEKRDSEIKEQGEASENTAKKVDELDGKMEDIVIELKEREEEIKAQKEELEKKSKDFDQFMKEQGRQIEGKNAEYKSVGQKFIESKELESMIANKDKKSKPVEFKNIFKDWQKKAITSGITGGSMSEPLRYPEIIRPGERIMRIRDLLNVQSTGTNAVEFVKETGFTNNADTVKETEDKSESELTFELETETVRTIAHWIPAPNQVLDDVSQLRAYIDTRMIYGLKLEEEAQILYGNGVNPNLTGIMPQANTYAWSDGETDDTKLDCIRRAMTVAKLAHYPVTGLVLHPSDWEDIELLKGSNGRYIWINVVQGGESQLWRVPVVETDAVNSGEALTGAFGLGAILWDREQSNIRITDSHEDYFIKNMLVILAEERLALTTFRPEAFVNIDFDNAPTGS
jgi:HK97 family phage major capsid protein